MIKNAKKFANLLKVTGDDIPAAITEFKSVILSASLEKTHPKFTFMHILFEDASTIVIAGTKKVTERLYVFDNPADLIQFAECSKHDETTTHMDIVLWKSVRSMVQGMEGNVNAVVDNIDSDTRERIHESFRNEDFRSAYQIASEYLDNNEGDTNEIH